MNYPKPKDGDWIQPRNNNFYLKCFDCELVHRLNFRLKGSDHKIQFQAFKLKRKTVAAPRGCACGEVLMGAKTPPDCKLFRKICTPQNPVGPCMVSSEGACAAYYKYEK